MVSDQNIAVDARASNPNESVQRCEHRDGWPVLFEHAGIAMGDGTQVCLPAPAPEMVRAARAYLTPPYAVGVDGFLWEAMEHPLPDLDAIDAVVAASDRAQAGAGDQPQPMDVAAALVVLGAARLEMDQTEARLLNAAQAAAMGWEQIAAILGLSVEEAEKRYRQLKPRLDEPVAEVLPPWPGGRPTHRPRAARIPR
ncbi:MAG: hypothetical protein QOE54_5488 [Streptosporangiaceae bacterium]|jgi:hypothetical protein|nr:hypothetical protein [Streptosporangiaceae bacterium]MDX6433122.1 hypothetical protein [Streptosporangiaceae bacterium]